MCIRVPFFFLLCCAFFTACQSDKAEKSKARPTAGKTLFTTVAPEYSGVTFSNDLHYTEEFNPYTFRNFFNGGGVGIGDVNNDGLPDIFFCGNLVDNKLYLNQGDFKFTEIAAGAGVNAPGVWSSGVSMADINADGWLDIYVCKSGKPGSENRHNELFINNADPDENGHVTFTEKSKQYGIGDEGLSTHAAFFDYDLDGDLDCYLLNNSMRAVGNYDLRKDQRRLRDTLGGNKLYRNDGEKFTDVSEAAGIYGSNIGFGLGVTIGDVNRDNYPDIFVSNDFFEKDYLYLNQQDGTFREAGADYLPEMSFSSMGADMADLNNDGYPEIFVTDMLPASNARMKTKTAFENWDKYRLNKSKGYHKQFTRNALHLNQALTDETGGVNFSDISRMAGVHATDWSWSALLADFDNDGRKDIFVANGILKDLTDQDYVMFFSDPRNVQALLKESGSAVTQMVDKMPEEAIANCVFQQTGDGFIPEFSDKAAAWGFAAPSFSNGSAYGDLDNDGDLDLVINNINQPAFLYRNEADTLLTANNFLKIVLKGADKNPQAVGSKVTLYAEGKMFYQEVNPMRGFESTVDARLNFGLGSATEIDSAVVIWYDGTRQTVKNIAAQQILEIEKNGRKAEKKAASAPRYFTKADAKNLNFTHRENLYDDFDRDRLLYHQRNTEGAPLAVSAGQPRIFYFGNAKGEAGALFIKNRNGSFINKAQPAFLADAESEDTEAAFFDADNDGDDDLYVASGGTEFSDFSSDLHDRLYFNDGRGNFTKAEKSPFVRFASTGALLTADFNGDGNTDIFVGERLKIKQFGVPVSGHLLLNDGKGNFTENKNYGKALTQIGMITDAATLDFDADGDPDLLLCGEWMSPKLFENTGTQFIDVSEKFGLNDHPGLWNKITVADFNGDGKEDFAIGNYGKNSRLKSQTGRPLRLYINDLDGNGSIEHFISFYEDTLQYPLALRSDLISQVPAAKKLYLKHEDYKNTTVRELIGEEKFPRSIVYEAAVLTTTLFLRDGEKYAAVELPAETQLAPVYALAPVDIDSDGDLDLITGGNLEGVKPELGTYTGSYGAVLENDGKGNFTAVSAAESGLSIGGEVRNFVVSNGKLIVAKSNGSAEVWKINGVEK